MDYLETIKILLIIVFCVQALGSAIYSAIVANKKGYEGALWFIGGLIFGLPALIATAGLPNEQTEVKSIKQKECPYCKENIVYNASKCKHCHSIFSEEEINKEEKEFKLSSLKNQLNAEFPRLDLLKELFDYHTNLESFDKVYQVLKEIKFMSSIGTRDTIKSYFSDMLELFSENKKIELLKVVATNSILITEFNRDILNVFVKKDYEWLPEILIENYLNTKSEYWEDVLFNVLILIEKPLKPYFESIPINQETKKRLDKLIKKIK